MKKMSLIALILAVAVLPGCRDKKKETTQSSRKNVVKTYAQTPDDDEIVEITTDDDNDDDEDEDKDIEDIDFSDLELDDINFEDMSDEELDKYLAALEEESDFSDLSDDSQAFNWVDAQLDDEFKKLYFSFNHYGIREDQKQALMHDIEQVKQLLADADLEDKPTVIIEGHACQEGTPSYNLALSEKRAKNVADLFVANGIEQAAIKVVARGQECPAIANGKVINGSREDRAPNRRVEVRVIYT